jgi:AraC-like DNA-binding protein
VDRIWSYTSGAGEPLPILLPGTGAELVFHLGAPPSARGSSGDMAPLPPAHLVCLRARSAEWSAGSPVNLIAVRLRSGALGHLLGRSPVDLHDHFPALEALWGSAVPAALERLASAATFEHRAQILCDLAERLAARAPALHAGTRAAIQRLYQQADLRIGPLAAELGWTRRTLERRLEPILGMAPKRFQRTARLYRTLRDLTLAGATDYLQPALENGFYDQAHFLHDLRALTGLSPRQLLVDRHFASHFYNRSWAR